MLYSNIERSTVILWFHETLSATTVQRKFRLELKKDAPSYRIRIVTYEKWYNCSKYESFYKSNQNDLSIYTSKPKNLSELRNRILNFFEEVRNSETLEKVFHNYCKRLEQIVVNGGGHIE